jgi:hypothetical protein
MRFWLTRTAIVVLCAAIAVVPLRAITYGFIDSHDDQRRTR